jgi:hypothetical protein
LLVDGKIWIRVAQKHDDAMDPDPQHLRYSAQRTGIITRSTDNYGTSHTGLYSDNILIPRSFFLFNKIFYKFK